ncbi:MAG TPA: hypothetical protein VJI68_00470 [Candidatus Nanoarchaeia archaeon]|nr:hypothetical protein [Candidatus Nanoarchaeia archaeon]
MVRKMHTRRLRYIPKGNERNRTSRLKTFLTEAAAKKHAEELGIKKFTVIRSKFGLSKKFKIIPE